MHMQQGVRFRLWAIVAGLAGIIFATVMPVRACDVAVVSARASTTGRPLIWKNYDCSELWHQEIKYFQAKKAGPGGYLMLYHKDNWMQIINGSPIVPQAGVNEAGLAMALTSVYENNVTHESGNLNTDLMQDALENCVTLTDFEPLVKTWPAAHKNHAISGNFVVIDAKGGAALYEMFTGYNTSGVMPIMYRKYDADTGQVTDQNGTVIVAGQSNYIGFVNRTNSHFWLPSNPGQERYVRGAAVFNGLAASTSTDPLKRLNPGGVMRVVARDIIGKQVYSNTNDSNYNTTYCINRSATRSGVVVDGVPNGGDPRLTTFWCALGEPSISIFVPYFASAKGVSPYAYMDTVNSAGAMSDTSDTCLLNLAEDYRETYNKLIYSSNRGSTINGPYDNYINKIELNKVLAWAYPVENNLFTQTDYFLNLLQSQGAGMTEAVFSQNLKKFSDYCAAYTYGNYTKASATAVPWSYVMP
jgi:hypothetical protein